MTLFRALSFSLPVLRVELCFFPSHRLARAQASQPPPRASFAGLVDSGFPFLGESTFSLFFVSPCDFYLNAFLMFTPSYIALARSNADPLRAPQIPAGLASNPHYLVAPPASGVF